MTCAHVSLHQEFRNDKNLGGSSSLPNRSANPNKFVCIFKNRMHKTRIPNVSAGGNFSLKFVRMPVPLFGTLLTVSFSLPRFLLFWRPWLWKEEISAQMFQCKYAMFQVKIDPYFHLFSYQAKNNWELPKNHILSKGIKV